MTSGNVVFHVEHSLTLLYVHSCDKSAKKLRTQMSYRTLGYRSFQFASLSVLSN